MSRDKQKIEAALEIAEWGGIDGSHHKMWVIDQMVQVLADDYEAWIKDYQSGDDGPETYLWDVGIAP